MDAELVSALAALAIAIIGLVKLTAWGKAHKDALELSYKVIEQAAQYGKSASSVKERIAEKEKGASTIVRDAIQATVAVVDQKKKTPKLGKVILKEVLRGLPKVAGLIKFVLLLAGVGVLSACLTGCASVPKIVTTYPDGRVVEQVDTAAVEVYIAAVERTAEEVMNQIVEYREREHEAKLEQDRRSEETAKERREFWERVLTMRLSLDSGTKVDAEAAVSSEVK